jgi:predicted DNA-binding protein YlxM (UPF0122 family)
LSCHLVEIDDSGISSVALCACGYSVIAVGDGRVKDAREALRAHSGEPVAPRQGARGARGRPRNAMRDAQIVAVFVTYPDISLEQIAERVGCSRQTVTRALDRRGAKREPLPRGPQPVAARDAQAVDLYLARPDLTLEQIAERVGTSRNTVSAALRRAGIERDRRERRQVDAA